MILSDAGLRDRAAWEAAGVRIPSYDRDAMRAETRARPVWIHFGAGNLFRAFHAMIAQSLLEQGLVRGGVYAAAPHGFETLDRVCEPHDYLSLLAVLLPDGRLEKTVVGSIAGGFRADPSCPADYAAIRDAFRNPSLQMVTCTITEKGYSLRDFNGQFSPQAEADFRAGPHQGKLAMSKITALLWDRFQAGGPPAAMVSTDNCSHNGEKFRDAVVTMAERWAENGSVSRAFADWLADEGNVSFPWTMIDKITPGPARNVSEALTAAGIEGMDLLPGRRGGVLAAFVNAEKPQYLVIEDRFPNGRPPLERAGVYLTDRETVNRVERMKVTTCLNPLHTALAVYGCLLGYARIADEMRDPELKRLAERIGAAEGMPVVTDPGIIRPADFLREVLEERLPNPYLPDTPQRIAMDTSQKVGVRFGETLKSCAARPDLDPASLTYIPLAIAGWMRYLLAVDDAGQPMACSSDPMLSELQGALAGTEFGRPESLGDRLRPILSNPALFGSDLYALGLGEKIAGMTREMLAGPGAVRAALKHYLD